MSRSVVGERANKALYVAGAFAVSLSISAFAASNAEAAPTTASWYGPGFAGNPTASGEPFNPNALTAAHKTLPFGTEVRICDDACAVVTINDRGPYANGAEYDLSRGAAEATGLIDEGVGTVDATVLGQGGSAEPAPAPEPEPAPEPAAPQAAAPQQFQSVPAGVAGERNDPTAISEAPAASESDSVASAASEGTITQSSTQNASGANINQSSQQSQSVAGDINVSGGQNASASQGGF